MTFHPENNEPPQSNERLPDWDIETFLALEKARIDYLATATESLRNPEAPRPITTEFQTALQKRLSTIALNQPWREAVHNAAFEIWHDQTTRRACFRDALLAMGITPVDYSTGAFDPIEDPNELMFRAAPQDAHYRFLVHVYENEAKKKAPEAVRIAYGFANDTELAFAFAKAQIERGT